MKLVRFLFLFFLFFLPHTKISIPAFLRYELTLADFTLIFLFFFSLVFIKKIDNIFSIYLKSFSLFVILLMFSVVNIRSIKYYIGDLVPYVFSLMIIVSTFTFFSQNVAERLDLLKRVFYVLFITFFLTTIPVYYQLITGVKLTLFYDAYAWRYAFLCQNPNQFGIFAILYSILLTVLSIHFFPSKLRYIFLLFIFFIPAALFSGSKTVALIFGVNLLFVAIVVFSKTSLKSKILLTPIFLFLLAQFGPSALETLKTKGGNINRALTIFEAISEQGASGVKVGGASGASMNEALSLFFKYPLTGVGLANKPMHSDSGVEIHNTYLKMIAESGIVGFFGFLIIFLLPLIAILFSQKDFFSKIIVVIFYLLFASMNWPHMLFRQRWVWFFMIMIFIIARVDKNGNIEKSKLAFLN